jgi:hypothetical protein
MEPIRCMIQLGKVNDLYSLILFKNQKYKNERNAKVEKYI